MIFRGLLLCLLVGSGLEVRAQETYVWEGVYSVAQAERGRTVYREACVVCHLEDFSGDGDAPPLRGRGFLVRWAELSVGDLVAAMRATMPKEAPDSLSFEAYVQLSAYLLSANGVPSGEKKLPVDMDALWNVVITEHAAGVN